MRRVLSALGFAIALAIPASDLFGYDTFGDGYGSKWDNPSFGTGAVVTAVRRALNTWARIANLTFVQVADSGGRFAGSTTPDIRIAAYHFPEGDIAGMREIYGPAAIPVPISPVAGGVFGLLLAALGARASSRRAV